MLTNNDNEAPIPVRALVSVAPVIRSYQQIANIMEAQEGRRVSAMRVGQMCRRAEAKLAAALQDDLRGGPWPVPDSGGDDPNWRLRGARHHLAHHERSRS